MRRQTKTEVNEEMKEPKHTHLVLELTQKFKSF